MRSPSSSCSRPWISSKGTWARGDHLTEADWWLFTTLVRLDPVYIGPFECNLRRITDYPNLSGCLRDLYRVPCVSGTVCGTSGAKASAASVRIPLAALGIRALRFDFTGLGQSAGVFLPGHLQRRCCGSGGHGLGQILTEGEARVRPGGAPSSSGSHSSRTCAIRIRGIGLPTWVTSY